MQKIILIPLLLLVSACQSARINRNVYPASPVKNDLAVYAPRVDETPDKSGENSAESGFDCLVSACQSTQVSSNDYPENSAMNDLAMYALSLDGTRYKYGGNSPESGFDCSGFVGHVFKKSLGKTLPRTSAEMRRVGTEQDLDDLQPGDLVFYNTRHKINSHVGIYLGEGKFIHSPSTGKSVRVVNMNDTYYRKHYNGARRINP